MNPTSNMLATQAILNSLDDIPEYRRPASRPTISLGFRIYKDQFELLKQQYDGKQSEIVRLLLDKFFAQEFPELEEKIK